MTTRTSAPRTARRLLSGLAVTASLLGGTSIGLTGAAQAAPADATPVTSSVSAEAYPLTCRDGSTSYSAYMEVQHTNEGLVRWRVSMSGAQNKSRWSWSLAQKTRGMGASGSGTRVAKDGVWRSSMMSADSTSDYTLNAVAKVKGDTCRVSVPFRADAS